MLEGSKQYLAGLLDARPDDLLALVGLGLASLAAMTVLDEDRAMIADRSAQAGPGTHRLPDGCQDAGAERGNGRAARRERLPAGGPGAA